MALIHNNITCKSTESQLLIYHTYNEIPTTNHIQFHRLTLNINLFTVFNLQNSFWSTNTSCWNISPKLFLHHPFNRIVNNPKSQTIKLYKTTQPSGKKKIYCNILFLLIFFFIYQIRNQFLPISSSSRQHIRISVLQFLKKTNHYQ